MFVAPIFNRIITLRIATIECKQWAQSKEKRNEWKTINKLKEKKNICKIERKKQQTNQMINANE